MAAGRGVVIRAILILNRRYVVLRLFCVLIFRCMACKGEIPLDKFTEVETTYTIVFNKRANVEKKKKVQTVD